MLERFRKWVRRLFPVRTIEQAYRLDAAISDRMLSKISEWEQMYQGCAPWCDGKEIVSLRLENAVVREFANVTLNEMTWNIRNETLARLFENAMQDMSVQLQRGLAAGGMVVKPLGVKSGSVQYLAQGQFVPLAFSADKRLTDVIFPEIRKISDNEFHIRLERHTLGADGLTITNRAFLSRSPDVFGREISLQSVPEWAHLPESVRYPGMTRPSFGFYVNPVDNTVDDSFCGISIFESAAALFQKADRQFGRIEWEYESARRRIISDSQGFRKNPDGTADISDSIFFPMDIENLFQEFSPALRDANFLAGLDAVKREIEFAVGLAYGDISNPQTVDKTATEILAAKQRKYNTVKAIQKNLKYCLDDLSYALAFWNGMTRNYDFSCTFKDSILADEQAERQQDMQDVQAGIMRPEEYRAKWYGEDLKTALQNLPQSAQVID